MSTESILAPELSTARAERLRLIAAAVFVFAGFALRMVLSWLDIEILFQKLVVDDAFFYLKLAQNIAAGNGATFDGEVMTNGFQPVFALLLVPIFLLNPANTLLPLHIALSILSVFSTLSGIVLYAIARRIGGTIAALITLFIWMFNPYAIMISLSGVEVAVLVFFEALSVLYYVKLKKEGKFGPLSMAVLGILLALAILSRVDAVFLYAAVSIDIIWTFYKKEKKFPVLAKRILWMIIASAVVSVPWLLWNIATFGTFQQVSGVVLPFTAHSMYKAKYGSYFSLNFIRQELYYLKTWIATIIQYGGGAPLLFSCLGFFVAARVLGQGGFEKTDPSPPRVNFLFVFFAFTVSFYAFYFWGWLRPWYYLSLLIPVTLFLGYALSFVCRGVAARGFAWMRKWAVSLLLILLSGYFVYYGRQAWGTGLFAFQKQLYDATLWIDDNLEPDARIGAFSSGIFGYLSNRTVIDLAGVVNAEVHRARLDKSLSTYFRQKELDYLIDRPDMVEFNLMFSEVDYRRNLVAIKRFGPLPSDLCVYKFNYDSP